MPGREKILLIITEAGRDINGLCSDLTEKGFTCSVTYAKNGVIERVTEQEPDLVMLEMNGRYPDSGTWKLPQRIKQARPLPIIALVNKEALGNLDVNLKSVDDFLIKPGDSSELVWRVKRLLGNTDSTDSSELIKCGDLAIDLAKCEVTLNTHLIELTFKEYELLKFLANHQGRVFSRDSLLNSVWGYDYFGGDRTVDVHIRRLRSKIEDASHTFIETVRNIGYRFKCNR
ncbi:MAG: response regulator transcription factor [Dehalococcoidales bacterium]|nr:response regulator transcription factor [Dehalococcoidales bacterium]